MVDITIGRRVPRTAYSVRRLEDKGEIRRILERDRAYAAYALAQLEPGLFELSRWYVSERTGPQAMVMHSKGGLGQALFTFGDPEPLDVALALHPGPHFTFGSLRLEHRSIVEKYFILLHPQVMLRMCVTAEAFRPVPGNAVRLTGWDIVEVNRLYSEEGGGRYSARNLDEGLYFGTVQDGRLTSIAGTHAISATEGVAVVGNVFTHPRFRNKGLASIATSAVTQALLETYPLVVLTVEAENAPAVRVYRNLGYIPEGMLHESPLIRKEPFGLFSLLRRLQARLRGRHRGVEAVLR